MKIVWVNGKGIQTTSTVDAVGLFCPMPVVKLKLEIEKLKPHEVIELLADDPGVLEDLPSWCKEMGNKLLHIGKNKESVYAAYIEKMTNDKAQDSK